MSEHVVGIIADPFDPVLSAHMHSALHALDSGRVSEVCFCLCPPRPGHACTASAFDRWRMLVAACSSDRRFIPFNTELQEYPSNGKNILLSLLHKRFPDTKQLLLKDGGISATVDGIQKELSSSTPSDLLNAAVREYISCLGLYGVPCSLGPARQWVSELFTVLKPHRFAHSLSVAGEAKKLAIIHGLDSVRAETAGLLHDCAKCLPGEEMKALAKAHRLTDDPGFLSSTALLHSLAGAFLAKETYGIEDPEILEAIAYHNTGCAGMSRLAMCVCLADSIEPLRDPYPFLPEARALSVLSLEKALLLSLERTAGYVLSRGKTLHPRTLETISWLKSLPACAETQALSGAKTNSD